MIMFKNIISPVQAWLLSQSRCVGCGMLLAKAEKVKNKNKTIVKCKCRRFYIHESTNKYRRALVSEV